MSPFLAVVVITNGLSSHFKRSSSLWMNEYEGGYDLFFCGPKANLLANGIPEMAIIDYVDPPGAGRFFHINHKKLHATNSVDAHYVYLVHDRFIPSESFKALLEAQIRVSAPDYGCTKVFNLDGSMALDELRLRRTALELPVEEALTNLGRLVCEVGSPHASEHIAVNGGEFFLRRDLAWVLSRPLRWVEMEDDVLSHDLRQYQGQCIAEPHLLSLNDRRTPSLARSARVRFRYSLYRAFCGVIALLLNLSTPGRKHLSVGRRIGQFELESMLRDGVYLIDPLHKMYSSEWLPSSLEKMMARARLMSAGEKWAHVVQARLGWKLR